jgi:hypothetical protein
MSVYVYEPNVEAGIEQLEDELTRAFHCIRGAIGRGDAVVVSLDERDVQARRSPAAAALAHGLLGLTRAFAIEGRKPGWRIAALSTPSPNDPEERLRWIEHLSESELASGNLIRLGGEHLGRVAP